MTVDSKIKTLSFAKDQVRISNNGNVFSKRFTQILTREVFVFRKVKDTSL